MSGKKNNTAVTAMSSRMNGVTALKIRSAQRYRSTRDDGSHRWLAIYELVDDPDEVNRRIAEKPMFRSPYYLRERTVNTIYAVLPPVGSESSAP